MATLSKPEVIVAMMVYSVFALVLPYCESMIQRQLADRPRVARIFRHGILALIRFLLLASFVCLAYPGLFNLSFAPSFSELIAAQRAAHGSASLGLALLTLAGASVLLPARKAEFSLPVQGILAAGLLFYLLTGYLGITTASLWPGIDIAVGIFLAVYVSHRIIERVDKLIHGDSASAERVRTARPAFAVSIALLAQMITILLFAFGLGRQIAI